MEGGLSQRISASTRYLEALDLKAADDPAWISRVDEARFNTQLDELAAKLEEAGGDIRKIAALRCSVCCEGQYRCCGMVYDCGCPEFAYLATLMRRWCGVCAEQAPL